MHVLAQQRGQGHRRACRIDLDQLEAGEGLQAEKTSSRRSGNEPNRDVVTGGVGGPDREHVEKEVAGSRRRPSRPRREVVFAGKAPVEICAGRLGSRCREGELQVVAMAVPEVNRRDRVMTPPGLSGRPSAPEGDDREGEGNGPLGAEVEQAGRRGRIDHPGGKGVGDRGQQGVRVDLRNSRLFRALVAAVTSDWVGRNRPWMNWRDSHRLQAQARAYGRPQD